ncbi:hypothetical protein RA280_47300 [Cupriavidus sp. CV2]|uniref:hypothetical protein n=1 Tax=Cupriavidus ulmosensis TaxID=3065913 RepID=UPI00296B13C1|nr:hypothetical protein [Cupriavidus sp. CV2]MDW3689192.1 hypothetical protein [Cupriavidus sp. CV2]
MTIRRAYCLELGETITADQARREYLSLEPRPDRLNFLCDHSPCRAAEIRVSGVAYKQVARESRKHVAAHFREWDKHLPGCPEVSGDNDAGSGSAGDDARNRKRTARQKLTDFVDVFDPRLKTEELRTRSTTTEPATPETGGRKRHHTGMPDDENGASRTTTRYLDKLVDTYLEARSILTDEEFWSLDLAITGEGRVKLGRYFRHIGRWDQTSPASVLHDGATIFRRYGKGFKLKFIDYIDGKPVFLYIAPELMEAYQYRRYLLDIVEMAEQAKYVRVFALGTVELAPSGKSMNVVVKDLRHLTLILPEVKEKDDSPKAASTDVAT